MKTESAPIADRKLWDDAGNYCRVTMYPYGTDTFEVFFQDFQHDVPRRFTGTLGLCNYKVDIWLWQKGKDGFKEQLPSFNPEAWIA
jgi:hypothetical protein